MFTELECRTNIITMTMII